MFNVNRLDRSRQLIVGKAIADALAAPRPTPLTATTVARGEAVVAASNDLRLFATQQPRKVDLTTDTMVVNLEGMLEAEERVLRDTVLPLGDPQREALARIRTLRTRLFPNGTGYIRKPMDMQWGELVNLQAAMAEPDVAAAIDAQGLRALADHLLAHIDLYGRILGHEAAGARTGEDEASAAWSEAMKLFAAQVVLDYEKDTEMQRELLGTYDAQLEQQRAVARAAVRARKNQPDGELPAPPEPEPEIAAPAGR